MTEFRACAWFGGEQVATPRAVGGPPPTAPMRHSIATCSLPPSPGAERTGISRTPCTVVDALSTVNGYRASSRWSSSMKQITRLCGLLDAAADEGGLRVVAIE